MTKKIDRRLDNLEHAASAKGKGGMMVLYADLEHDGYWENKPTSADPGKHFSEAEKDALEGDTLFIIEYVKDWRVGVDQEAI